MLGSRTEKRKSLALFQWNEMTCVNNCFEDPTPADLGEAQGFSATTMYKMFELMRGQEKGILEKTIDFAISLKEMIVAWAKMVYEMVCTAMKKIKDEAARWAAVIKTMVEAIFTACKDKVGKIGLFFRGLAAAGASVPDQIEETVTVLELNQKNKEELERMETARKIAENNVAKSKDDESDSEWVAQGDDDPWYSRWPERAMGLATGLVVAITSICESIITVMDGKSAIGIAAMMTKCASAYAAVSRIDFAGHMKFLFNTVYHWFTGENYFMVFEMQERFTKTYTEACQLIIKVEACRNPPTELLTLSAALLAKIDAIYPAVLELSPEKTNVYKTQYDYISKKLEKWATSSRGSKRMKPVTIVLSGESSCGKTWTQKSLILHIMKQVLKYFSPESMEEDMPIFHMHAKDSSSMSVNCIGDKQKYDEGYMDQLIYIFEELFTNKNPTNKTEWAEHFMRLIDDQPLMLEMAFGDKGKRFFVSPFVIATGNFREHYVPFEDPTAYYRRIEFDLKVTRIAVPQGEEFDVYKHTRYQFTPQARAIMQSDKCPSPILRSLVKSGFPLDVRFNYPVLLRLIAAVYIQRITYNSVEPAESVELPSFLNTDQKLFDKAAEKGTWRNLSSTYYGQFKNIPMKAPIMEPRFNQGKTGTTEKEREVVDQIDIERKRKIVDASFGAVGTLLQEALGCLSLLPKERTIQEMYDINLTHFRLYFKYIYSAVRKDFDFFDDDDHRMKAICDTCPARCYPMAWMYDIVKHNPTMTYAQLSGWAELYFNKYCIEVKVGHTPMAKNSTTPVERATAWFKAKVEEGKKEFANWRGKLEASKEAELAAADVERNETTTTTLADFDAQSGDPTTTTTSLPKKPERMIGERRKTEMLNGVVVDALGDDSWGAPVNTDPDWSRSALLGGLCDLINRKDRVGMSFHTATLWTNLASDIEKFPVGFSNSMIKYNVAGEQDNVYLAYQHYVKFLAAQRQYVWSLPTKGTSIDLDAITVSEWKKLYWISKQVFIKCKHAMIRTDESHTFMKKLMDKEPKDQILNSVMKEAWKGLSQYSKNCVVTDARVYYQLKLVEFRNTPTIVAYSNGDKARYQSRLRDNRKRNNTQPPKTFEEWKAGKEREREAARPKGINNKTFKQKERSKDKARTINRNERYDKKVAETQRLDDVAELQWDAQSGYSDMERFYSAYDCRWKEIDYVVREKHKKSGTYPAIKNIVWAGFAAQCAALTPTRRARLDFNSIKDVAVDNDELIAFTFDTLDKWLSRGNSAMMIAGTFHYILPEERRKDNVEYVACICEELMVHVYCDPANTLKYMRFAVLLMMQGDDTMDIAKMIELWDQTHALNPKIEKKNIVIMRAYLSIMAVFTPMDEKCFNSFINLARPTNTSWSGEEIAALIATLCVGVVLVAVVGTIIDLLVKYYKAKNLMKDLEKPDISPEQFDRLKEDLRVLGYELYVAARHGDVQAQGSPDQQNLKKQGKIRNIGKLWKEKNPVVSQAGQEDVITASIQRNQYAMLSETEMSIMGSCTAFGGQLVHLNTHVWNSLTSIKLLPYTGTDGVILRCAKSDCRVIDTLNGGDLTIVAIPCLRVHKRIVQHYVTRQQLNNLDLIDACQISHFDDTPSHLKGVIDVTARAEFIDEPGTVRHRGDKFKVSEHFVTKWQRQAPGKCGALNMGWINGQLKIFGQHMAGHAEKGMAASAVVTKEMLDRYLPAPNQAKLDPNPVNVICFEEQDNVHDLYKFDTQSGEFKTPCQTNATDSTCFVETAFQRRKFLGGAPKSPAVLTYEAYEMAVQKERATKEIVSPHEDVYSIISEFAEHIVQKGLPCSTSVWTGCRTLTPEEALYDYKSLPKFDAATSKGMRLRTWKMSKRELLEGNDKVYQQFMMKLKPILEAFDKGEYTYQMCADKLKDELRDLVRVSQKKTRVFNVTDFVDNVLIKMAIGDLVEKTKHLYAFAPAACGVNPGTEVWQMIHDMFKGHGVVCSDISAFDHTAAAWLMIFFNVLICKAYPVQKDRMFALWALWSCMMAVRYNRGNGRFIGRGNSSGNWITTFMNTWVNLCYFCVCAVILARENGDEPHEIIDLLRIKLYSDDNLSAMPDVAWWTPVNISRVFRDYYHITLTTTDKGDAADLQLMDISECDFLCREFRLERGRVFCPISRDSLLAQLYYVRCPKSERVNGSYIIKQVQTNLDNVARELMEWDREKAVELANEISNFIGTYRLPYHFNPRFDLDAIEYKVATSY